MDSISDEQLIAQVMMGSQKSMEALVERYHGPLLGYLFRLTNGNRLLAEDLVQDTFIRLLQQNSYQRGRPFKPWLYSIATHLVYDYFRSQSTHPITYLDEEVWADWKDPSGSLEERIQENHAGAAIVTALAQLSEEYQAAILLRFYQGLSFQEIAEALQIPLGTVKSRLSTGVQRLRGLLLRIEKGEK